MGAREGIQHVVVLMLENRSFDCMLGNLYPENPNYEGFGPSPSDRYVNPYHSPDGTTKIYPVWNDTTLGPASVCIPDPDPGEYFTDMNMQLFGLNGIPNRNTPPTMDGFVDNYMRQPDTAISDPMAVMHFFTPQQVPVISTLAKAFGVCDQWYASAPCQTWPNRFFTHSGTCRGYVNNNDFPFPFEAPTIFGRFRDKGKSWGVYFHDVAQTFMLSDIWLEVPTDFFGIDDFVEHARQGNLPNYSFIEPRYLVDDVFNFMPNDEHPPYNAVYGEQLIAQVYNAVRSAPTWKSTLLIITYDEHGGCYDHMPPPQAVSPDTATTVFAFDRYGVRVPAVIVSPYMPPGGIVRSVPTGITHEGLPPFDHTSIIATLRDLFDLGDPLTNRDKAAPSLLGPLSLEEPENDGPPNVDTISVQPSQAEIEKAKAAPPNQMQQNLRRMKNQLPPDVAAKIPAHIKTQ